MAQAALFRRRLRYLRVPLATIATSSLAHERVIAGFNLSIIQQEFSAIINDPVFFKLLSVHSLNLVFVYKTLPNESMPIHCELDLFIKKTV
jgi:hypothetical protein